jgi:hypothetical protein
VKPRLLNHVSAAVLGYTTRGWNVIEAERSAAAGGWRQSQHDLIPRGTAQFVLIRHHQHALACPQRYNDLVAILGAELLWLIATAA